MTVIVSFFTTTIGEGLWNALCNILNLGFILGSGIFLYFSLIRELRRHRSSRTLDKSDKNILKAISAAIILIICALNIMSGQLQNVQGSRNALFYLFQLTLTLLDPILNISTLADSPFSSFNLTGPNLFVRVLLLYLILVVIHKAYRFAHGLDKEFGVFLKQTIHSSSDADDGLDANKAQTGAPSKPDADKVQASAPSEPDRIRSFTMLLEALMKFIPGTGVIGGVLAYILGGEDTRKAVKDVLDTVRYILDTITLTANLLPDAPGAVTFFTNFLFIILSICILAVYGSVISAMIVFAYSAWNNRKKILDWISQRGPALFLCGGVVCLILLASAVVFLTGSGFDTVKNFFLGMFQSQDVFDTVARFVLMILCLCVVVLMLGFILAFSFFVAELGYLVVRKSWKNLNGSSKIPIYAKLLTFLIVGAGVLLGIGYGYRSISQGLQVLFPGAQSSDTMSLLWVVGHILLLILIVLAALLISVVLIKATVSFLANLLVGKPGQPAPGSNLLGMWKRPFALVWSPIRTMLQIFIGYSTESEKNRAILLAACFASLASLLNTFFGLIDFYTDTASAIPLICSFAIACAVQLAMLIFGMKAGEGLAERLMMDTVPARNGYFWAIALRVYAIIACLLIYAILLCTVLTSKPWGKGNGIALNLVFSIGLLLLSGAIILSVSFRQAMDVLKLWRMRKQKPQPEADGGARTGRSGIVFRRGTKRLAPGFYLTVYLLLMIVSTGFAFNNLFGYYADQAGLHEQVYNQVLDQADRVLQPGQKISDVVTRYENNTNQIITSLENRTSAINAKLAADRKKLEDNVNKKIGGTQIERDRAQNLVDRYVGDTRDFSSLVRGLRSYIEMDAGSIGRDATITIQTNKHFWGGNSQPSYTTTCAIIRSGSEETVIGTRVNSDPKTKVTVNIDGKPDTTDLTHRLVDPDSEEFSIEQQETPRAADKYSIVEELLSLFDSQEQAILNYDAYTMISNSSTSAPTSSSAHDTGSESAVMRELLSRNAILEDVADNLTKQIRNETAAAVPVRNLPYLVVNYISDQGDDEPTDKLAAYRQMSEQIDKMLAVDNILTVADSVLKEEENGSYESADKTEVKTGTNAKPGDDTETTQSYLVKEYRSYARGITHSNLQISYDTLLCGLINKYSDDINALYRSSLIAGFILLICALVDLMAFFGGLLLFKEIFLFRKNQTLETVGYLNYDALLTNLFTLPRNGPMRMLYQALIYRLLYGDPELDHADLPSASNVMNKLSKILASREFQALYDETWEVLRQLDIDENNMPELQQWLLEFLQKNRVDFDEL